MAAPHATEMLSFVCNFNFALPGLCLFCRCTRDCKCHYDSSNVYVDLQRIMSSDSLVYGHCPCLLPYLKKLELTLSTSKLKDSEAGRRALTYLSLYYNHLSHL